MGHGDRALALAEQALVEAGRGASSEQERRARQVLAQCLRDRGDVAEARRTLAPALPVGSELTTDVDAYCFVTQVELDLVVGALEDAEGTARIVLAGDFGSRPWLGGAVRHLLGDIMLERGDVELARSWLSEAVALNDTIGDFDGAVDAHLRLVGIECAAGCTDAADAHLRAAARVNPNSHRSGVANLAFLQAGAALALCTGSPAQAVGLADAALAHADENSSVEQRCVCLRLLGDAQLSIGDAATALSTFERLVARAQPYVCRGAEGHEGAAAANIVLGRVDAARCHLDEAAEIRRRTGTRRLPRPVVEEQLVTVS